MQAMTNMNGELHSQLAELERFRAELKVLREKNRRYEAEIASLTQKVEGRDLEKEHYEKWFKHYETENDKMLEVVP